MGRDVTVSICLPTFDSADTIARALDSALAQAADVVEVLLVDDGSTDATVQIARSYRHPTLRVVASPGGAGLAGNHNRCLELARGDVVQFLHADDELLPGAVAGCRDAFADPGVALAFGPRVVVSDDDAWLRDHGDPHGPLGLRPGRNDGRRLVASHLGTQRLDNLIGEPSSVMVRRSAALGAGGFRAAMTQWVDIDLWLRMLARPGADAVWVPEPRAVRHHHLRSATYRVRSRRRERWAPVRLGLALTSDPATAWPARRAAVAFLGQEIAALAGGASQRTDAWLSASARVAVPARAARWRASS